MSFLETREEKKQEDKGNDRIGWEIICALY
jgi:hypothetical protein